MIHVDGRVINSICLSVYVFVKSIYWSFYWLFSPSPLYLSLSLSLLHSLSCFLFLPPSLILLYSTSFSPSLFLSLPPHLSHKNGVYEQEDVEHNLTYLLLQLKEVEINRLLIGKEQLEQDNIHQLVNVSLAPFICKLYWSTVKSQVSYSALTSAICASNQQY